MPITAVDRPSELDPGGLDRLLQGRDRLRLCRGIPALAGELDRFEREQGAQFGIDVERERRLARQLAHLGQPSGLLGVVALHQEQRARRERDHEQEHGSNEHSTQAPLAALLACQLGAQGTVVALCPVPAGLDQFADQRWDVAASRSPVGRELEPAATEHVVVGATLRVPAASCRTDVTLERDVGARLLQPGDHLGPGAEHDLVHDVEFVAGAGDETGIDERVDRGRRARTACRRYEPGDGSRRRRP